MTSRAGTGATLRTYPARDEEGFLGGAAGEPTWPSTTVPCSCRATRGAGRVALTTREVFCDLSGRGRNGAGTNPGETRTSPPGPKEEKDLARTPPQTSETEGLSRRTFQGTRPLRTETETRGPGVPTPGSRLRRGRVEVTLENHGPCADGGACNGGPGGGQTRESRLFQEPRTSVVLSTTSGSGTHPSPPRSGSHPFPTQGRTTPPQKGQVPRGSFEVCDLSGVQEYPEPGYGPGHTCGMTSP